MRVAVKRSGFSPSQIPNLVLHLDAKQGVYVDSGATLCTDGQTVQQWNDQSGNGHHLLQSGAPTYRAAGFSGQPSVQFGEGLSMVSPEFLDAGYDTAATMFWIGAPAAGGSSQPAMSANNVRFATGSIQEWCRVDISELTGEPAQHYYGAQTLTGNIRCVGVSYDGSTLRTIINGHLVKLARTGNLGLSGALTVGQYSSMNHWFVGHLAGCYMWNAAANDAQMRFMCDWLLAQWGLSKPTLRQSIVYTGDSLTSFNGTIDRWPNVIAAAMGTTAQSHTIVAQPGVSLSFISSIAAGWVDPMLDADSQDLQVHVIWAGTNDIAGGWTGAGTYSALADYCAARYAAGWDRVIILTMLPRSAGGDDPDTETERQAYNALIRANWESIADGLADVASDGRIGDAGDELDTTYYENDRVHLNATGHGVVAGIVQPVLSGLL